MSANCCIHLNLRKALKWLEQLLVPSGSSCLNYPRHNPFLLPTVAWPWARSWEEAATHSGQLMKECKHKTQRDMAGTKVSSTSRCPELKKKSKNKRHLELARSKQFVKEMTAEKVGEGVGGSATLSHPGTDTTAGLGDDWFDVSL